MAEIQRSQTYPVSIERCFEGLRRVLPATEIQVKKTNLEAHSTEGNWNPGGTTLVFRAECKDLGEGNSEVTIRHDLQWTSMLSRPNLRNEKAVNAFNEKVFGQMERVLDTLGKYLVDETSLPKITPGMGLDLDLAAWTTGAIVSIGLRLLADIAAPGWFHGIANTEVARSIYLRIVGIAGVLVGGVAAGLVKRRAPLKGSAFYEGLIVALANVSLSILIYKPYFSMGCVDWGIYGLTGFTFASLASMQFGKKNPQA
jgi:hypothetical protein